MKEKATSPPVAYAGWHQANHWAITYEGDWQAVSLPEATFGDALRTDEAGAEAIFTFEGSNLDLAFVPSEGQLRVQIDQGTSIELDLNIPESIVDQSKIPKGHDAVNPPEARKAKSKIVNLAHTLPQELHQVRLEVVKEPVIIDGFIVENRPNLALNRAGSAIMVLATLVGLGLLWKQRRARQREQNVYQS
jgi:hypothetical protein